MSGKRYSLPNLDDVDAKINNDNYKDSNYVSPDAKTSVKNTTDQQTDKMSASAPTTISTESYTSYITGGLAGEPCGTPDQILEDNINQSEKDNLKYIADNNPEYLDEMGLSPDEIFGINISGDSGYTSQDAEFITDENGLTYFDNSEFFSTNQNLSGSQIVGTGQPQIIKVTTEFANPIEKGKYFISSPFGFRILPARKNWEFHGGIDMAAKLDTPVCAIYDGIIYDAVGYDKGNGYGLYIILQFVYKGRTYHSFYAHLNSILVKTGDSSIKKGQVIGYVGATGIRNTAVKGEHLHFEIRASSIKDPDTKEYWTCPTQDINDPYSKGDTISNLEKIGGRAKCWNRDKLRNRDIIDDNSLVFLTNKDGTQTLFQPKDRFKFYIDPIKFLSNPSDSSQWHTR